MKQLIRLPLLCLLAAGSMQACDDGKIYPEDPGEATGGKATMNVVFTGQEAWPTEYMLIMGAFGEDESMPVISKIISKPGRETDPVSVTLNGLNDEIRQITVSVANKGRQPLFHFYTEKVENMGDAQIELSIDRIDLASFTRIQQQVFDNYCVTCHGAGDYAAGGLDLTAGQSYGNLVNVEAELSDTGELFVEPGRASRSFLVTVLKEDLIRYNHTDVLPEDELITLIETWIDNGAEE